ncbi:hypothetical protein KY290_011052 [Solanum tuberosum]|uniref:Uncharacterized protein n=1 Tax=Solanum tuberosum TaxID=4113 RepID=A0ABQ7W017_SOLTU|nr:hypothetical protein KY290_011052 [Solanum tuberosum]
MHLEGTVTTPGLPTPLLAKFVDLNLEDKVLIEDKSIFMNQVKPNMDTKVKQVVIGLTRTIGLRTSKMSRLIWDPGRVVGARKVPLKGVVVSDLGMMHIEDNVCHLLFF